MDEGVAFGPIDSLPEGYAPALPAGPEYGSAPPLRSFDIPGATTGAHPATPGPAEHHGYEAPTAVFDVYAPTPAPMRPRRPPPLPTHAQAVGAAEPTPSSHLGLSLLALAMGIGIGAKRGGLAGAAGGALIAGAAVNGYQAFSSYRLGTPAGDKEGAVSALYALVGAVGGGWLWMKYVRGKERFTENPDPTEDAWSSGRCGIRRAG